MKTLLLSIPLLLCSAALFSQDKIYKHSGETLDVKVVRVTNATIVFRYHGEEAEQVLGKLAVRKVQYGSGRTEDISEKIVVNSKDDWELVELVTDKELVTGLRRAGDVRGKTSGVLSYHTAGSADRKAMRKMLESAAQAGMPIVLLTSENDARANSIGMGTAQGIKKGVAYSYK